MKGKTTNWNNKIDKVLYFEVKCGGTNHLLEEKLISLPPQTTI